MYKTMEEIQKEYDGYWVFMVNCKKNEYGSVIGGEVEAYDKDKRAIYRAMGQHRGGDLTSARYVGKIPHRLGMII